jgi:hypothetical protein
MRVPLYPGGEDRERQMQALVEALAVWRAEGIDPWDAMQGAFEVAWGRTANPADAHDIMLCQEAVLRLDRLTK